MTRLIWRLFPIVLTATSICVVVQAQSRDKEIELATLMDRVGERVNTYYVDLQKFTWTDTVRQLSLRDDQTPQGNPRDLVYDMIIRLDPDVRWVGVPSPPPPPLPPFFTKDLSELISVDGKPFLKGDSPERSDPKAGDIGLLWILLWAPRRTDHSYKFSFAGREDLDGRKMLMVDIAFSTRGYSVGPIDGSITGSSNRVPSVVWQGDSFAVKVQQTGRIWIDPDTYDVLRLETRTKPFEFEKPDGRGKLKFEFGMTARFRSMTVENPKQTLMVPESIETVRTVKGMQPPVVRTTHTFGNFKRFAADVKIIP